MLRSNLCDFSDAYILVKGVITVRTGECKKKQKRWTYLQCTIYQLYFKN